MSNTSNKPVVHMENWRKQQVGVNTETSEKMFVMLGDAKGHPRLGNENVRTSLIVNTDDKTFAETLNTYYTLGEPA